MSEINLASGITNKIVRDMSNHDYHALRDSFSSTQLKYLLTTSPRHFKAKYIDGDIAETKSTPALTLGSLVHCLVLTPGEISKEFVFLPDLDLRTKVGRAEKASIELVANGRLLVTEDVRLQAVEMSNAVLADPSACKLLADCENELSYFWTCPHTGLRFRARADGYAKNTKALIELKTGKDMSPLHFQRQAYNLNYDLSMAHYMEGLRRNDLECSKGYFITVESAAPYVVQCYQADDSFIDLGHQKWLEAITKLMAGKSNDKWPSYVDAALQEYPLLMPPAWAKNTATYNDSSF